MARAALVHPALRRRVGLGVLAANVACSPGALDVGTDAVKIEAGVGPADATIGRDGAEPLSVSLTQQLPDACGGGCVELIAQAAGGSGPYAYGWTPALAADGAIVEVCPEAATTYTVTVTDQSGRAGELPSPGMTASATATIDVPSGCGGDGGAVGDAASIVYWADWQSADAGTAAGVLSPPSGAVQVTYVGALAGAQTTSGTDDFVPTSTFTSATVFNAPPGPGMLEVAGGSPPDGQLTFSAPVKNPVLAIYSLGTAFASQPSTIVFDVPFEVLSSGPNASGTGYWGTERLVPADGGLSGIGANGVVELEGTFSTIHWINPADIPFASFTGLTVGIRAQN